MRHVLAAALPGRQAVDFAFSAIRRQDAAHDLDGARLARAVWADIAHHLAILNLEGHVLQRVDLCVLPMKQRLDRPAEPGPAPRDPECLAHILQLDHFDPPFVVTNVRLSDKDRYVTINAVFCQ